MQHAFRRAAGCAVVAAAAAMSGAAGAAEGAGPVDGQCIHLISKGELPGARYLAADASRRVTLSDTATPSTVWQVRKATPNIFAFSFQADPNWWLDGDRDKDLSPGRALVSLVADAPSQFTVARWTVAPDGTGGYTLESQHGGHAGAKKYLDGATAEPDHPVYLSPSTTGIYTGAHWRYEHVDCVSGQVIAG
ncbi:MAG: hypothetical protein JOZ72_19470 [Alphaproteobacteria bacterium]|nr:hypothetical protein [Alphaproteobacteria bacterium]